MSQTFGARLRQRRERQKIALAAISEQTKINLSLLEALERDDVSRWPVGIFRRAYVRSYAQAIGLDPNVLVREFLERYPDPLEEIDSISETAARAGAQGGPPPTRFRYIVGSAVRSLSGRREFAQDSPAAARIAPRAVPSVNASPSKPLVPSDPDLLATAQLCTALGRAERSTDMQPLLQEAARIVDALGLIVWVWDREAEGLRAAWSHGYPEPLLAQLPLVRRNGNNATAEAFRTARTCAVGGSGDASGALVVPMLAPSECVGVLAIEFDQGGEESAPIRSLANIFAAQLARAIGPADLSARGPS
jgi:GAF domain-containing protein